MKKLLPFIILLLTGSLLHAQDYTPRAGGKTAHPVLNHIAIYVVSLKTSTDFYTNVIQLDTIPEPFHDHKHTWFAIGPVGHLHVIEGAKEAVPHDKNVHLCFSVKNMNDFIGNLNYYKVNYEDWPGHLQTVTTRVDGVHQIYFKDPDGYWIEINDAKN
jgi:lactoylglutathione lyase